MSRDEFLEKYLNKTENDETGFNEMIRERQVHLDALRERLSKYRLTDDEMNEVFDVIEKAEIEMEEVKRSFNGQEYGVVDKLHLSNDLARIQLKMKKDFEEKLNSVLERKYNDAKMKLQQQELDDINPFG